MGRVQVASSAIWKRGEARFMATFQIEASAIVEPGAELSDGVRIWHHAQVRTGAKLGANVIVGKGAYIGTGVEIGANSKVQNSALIYEPARLGQGVFVGPGAIFTNDRNPRAINSDLSQKSASDWNAVGVVVDDGASIGAGAICVAPVHIGKWAMVAAGAVVTSDLPAFALAAGVPAQQIGWVGTRGVKLQKSDGNFYVCPESGERYELVGSTLREVK
jgi:UDP-2-acetamido-3-amino-2,3-dideoxy-glucuronate N-acetyltransferase